MNDTKHSTHAPAAGQRPRRGAKLVAVATGLAAALLVLEVALRLVPAAISPKLLILFDPELRSELAAGEFPLQKDFREIARDDGGPPLLVPAAGSRIVSIDPAPGGVERNSDELGFCNPPGRAARARADVVALGDSFTWCHALLPSQAWPAVLEERTGLATVSLGLGGKGLYEYVQLLRELGLAKQPRVVVMGVYGGNDLRDADFYRRWRAAVERGETPPANDPRNVAPWLVSSAIGRHSHAINFLVAAASRVADWSLEDWEKSRIDAHYRILLPGGEVEFNVQNRDRDEVLMAGRLQTGAVQPDLWDDALTRFVALAREHGFTPVVAYMPAAYAAYTGKVAFADPSIAPLLDGLDEAQRRHLAARAAKLGYQFHDFSPDLREATAHEDAAGLLYDPVHVHLTVRGHEIVAESLQRFLDERGLGTRPN